MSWQTQIDRAAAKAIAEVRDACQLARLQFGIAPYIYLNSNLPLQLPYDIGACADCGNPLYFCIDAWEAYSGLPEEIDLICPIEDDAVWDDAEDEIHEHPDWAEWQRLNQRALRWARRRIRRID